jgi:CBS domain containing-hemolysin-like protein
MEIKLISLFFLVFLSGFFSSAEIALFSLNEAKTRHLAKNQDKFSQLIRRMKENPHRLLTTILIGNNLVNIAASSLATAAAIEVYGSTGVGIATGVMTFLILVFGEILPKSMATHNNLIIAKIVIYPLFWLYWLFFPFIKIMDFIPLLIGRIDKLPTVTEEELLTYVEVGEEEGEIRREERELIRNVFEFDDISASEIMRPRRDMFVIDIDNVPEMRSLLEAGFSRFPVKEGNIDNIIGTVHIKDIFRYYSEHGSWPSIREVMREPYFIPEHKRINTLLHQFKYRKNHMAIVVDEHGGVSGLITLEDVLEEIVGEISDETDYVEPHIVKIKANEWIVLGKAAIEDVNRKLKQNIPESPSYDTFSGYILEYIGRIPEEKEVIEIGSLSVTVKEMEKNRIGELIVRLGKKAS